MQLVTELNQLLEMQEHQINVFTTTPNNGNGHGKGYDPYIVLAKHPWIPELLKSVIAARLLILEMFSWSTVHGPV